MASSRKILIVEDDIDLAGTLALPLEMHDHLVSVAFNGVEAIRLSQGNTFDICFLDIKMPGMNGIECLRKIRELLPAQTRYIMMTGFREEALLEEALQAGARQILLKPFKMSEFLRCVDELAA
jgi:DNA-binding response OmpR family regulator